MELASQTMSSEPNLEIAILPPPAWHGWAYRFGAGLWVVVCGWALYGLHKEWSGFHLQDLNRALSQIGPIHLLGALALTMVSYICNAAITIIGQYWAGYPIKRLWRDLTISYISSAFTMNAGGSVLGGGSIRMRFAASQGISVGGVSKITLFCACACWAGHALACGTLLIIAPPPFDWLPSGVAGILGYILVIGSIAACAGRAIWRTRWPAPGLAFSALLVSAIDWLGAGLAMWVLFPGDLPLSVWSFVAVITISQAIAALSHVPGGVGVLEFAITKTLSGLVAAPVLAGTLVTYRLVFYLLPFCLAILLLGIREVKQLIPWLLRGGCVTGRRISVFAPRLASLLVFGGGFVLLLSASTPIEEARRGALRDFLPLPFVETSHFISSLIGALLIVLARGLQRRIQAAWWLSITLMVAAIVFSLVKGFDWEEALILAFVVICLLPFRRLFHRHSTLWTYRFTVSWWLMMFALLGVAIWLGFFTLWHVPYQQELWWQFTFESDASRFMRAGIGASCVFAIIALLQALRPAKSRIIDPVTPAITEELVRRSGHAGAALAFLSDKSFTLGNDNRCGLMHADQGRSRIVMGDPLGAADEADDLLWKFVEQTQSEGMRPVFYQVSVAEMPRLVDMGFKLFKLGEEASVDLVSFSLEGRDARRLRHSRNRLQAAALSFEIWDQSTVVSQLSILRGISDSWLQQHRAGEKGFSLGRFDDDYIRRFRCGIVKNINGEVVAFTNILTTEGKEEISVDLMRHLPNAPNGVMEAIFIELMIWGHEQGFKRFNLGMAPLSGLSTHPMAPLWNRLAAGIFHRGEALYNFQGLRSYKDKFNPEWEPRYIAVQSTWSLPSALLDVTVLIGGGFLNTLSTNKS